MFLTVVAASPYEALADAENVALTYPNPVQGESPVRNCFLENREVLSSEVTESSIDHE